MVMHIIYPLHFIYLRNSICTHAKHNIMYNICILHRTCKVHACTCTYLVHVHACTYLVHVHACTCKYLILYTTAPAESLQLARQFVEKAKTNYFQFAYSASYCLGRARQTTQGQAVRVTWLVSPTPNYQCPLYFSHFHIQTVTSTWYMQCKKVQDS